MSELDVLRLAAAIPLTLYVIWTLTGGEDD